jgi:putative metallohydrolase (TIGR04338 family)
MDQQAERLYEAENSVFSFRDPRNYLGTVPAVEKFLDHVVSSAWFLDRWPVMEGVEVQLHDGRGSQSAWASPNVISLPRWARRKLVVLHELAHVVTWTCYGACKPAHGRTFARVYLMLVWRVLGQEAARELHWAFRRHGVRFQRRVRKSD